MNGCKIIKQQKRKAVKRIKHNDLTHYFLREHSTLPRAYLRKCEKFFQSIQDKLITKKDASFLFRHQADKQREREGGPEGHKLASKKKVDKLTSC